MGRENVDGRSKVRQKLNLLIQRPSVNSTIHGRYRRHRRWPPKPVAKRVAVGRVALGREGEVRVAKNALQERREAKNRIMAG